MTSFTAIKVCQHCRTPLSLGRKWCPQCYPHVIRMQGKERTGNSLSRVSKACPHCKLLLPIGAFGKRTRNKPNGKTYMMTEWLCIDCNILDKAERYERKLVPLSAKICPTCEIEFMPSRRDKRYCSQSCCSKANYSYTRPTGQVVMHIIECEQCGDSFFNFAVWKRKCDACKLANVRLAARERMRRLRADPILGPGIKADGWERLRLWRLANPEKVTAKNKIANSRRKAQKRQLPGTLTAKEWERTLEFFEWSCAYCGEPSRELEQEHFVPLSKGGGYTKGNIVPACKACNSSKRAKLPQDWLPIDVYNSVSSYLVKGVE